MAISTKSTGGGTGMMDSFSQLGMDIQNQSNMQIDQIMKWTQMMEEMRRQRALDEENERQFNVGTALTTRNQNLAAQNYLQSQRDRAGANARVRTFRKLLVGA
jgi:hypothetical protein